MGNTWDDLSMADLCALYEHATAYTIAAAQHRNNGINTLSEKDQAWHKYWRDLKVKIAHTIFKRTQSLQDQPATP